MRKLGTRVGGRIRFISCLSVLLALPCAAPAQSPIIEPGHTAMWFDPARSGEGWVLEILHDDRALLYWYTYDDDGNQRWLQGVGSFTDEGDGDTLEFPDLYITRGGRFGPNFDPDEVEIELVGEAVMTFADCDHGTFSYSAFGQSQIIDIQRLSQTMAAGCAPIHGVTGEPVREYAGQSGSWYDVSHSGEGFSMHWLSRDEALLTWYTYDGDGNQRWMIGVGQHEEGRIVFPMLHTTRGGRFGEAFDPDDVELVEWGSLEMELECSTGQADYESLLPAFGADTFDLNRLTQPARPACPWVRPKLTDLYEITWNEIPIGEDELISALSIADDGTIAGIRRSDTSTGGPRNLEIWRPDTQNWQTIPGEIDARAKISADGKQVLSRKRDGRRIIPAIWTEETGWEQLPGLIYDVSYPSSTGISKDFSHIVGFGNDLTDNRGYPWIWDAENGQRQLPLTEDVPGGDARAVSNDGKTVVGDMHTIHVADHGVGLMWTNESDPEILLNDQDEVLGAAELCNHDCSIVAGYGLAGLYNDQSEAWFKTKTGQFGFLGELSDAAPIIEAYIPRAITIDGSLIVGRYSIYDPDGILTTRAFIWTQNTGIISVRTLVEEGGIGDDDWGNMNAISVSSHGDRILLTGSYSTSEPGETRPRAVVLELSALQAD